MLRHRRVHFNEPVVCPGRPSDRRPLPAPRKLRLHFFLYMQRSAPHGISPPPTGLTGSQRSDRTCETPTKGSVVAVMTRSSLSSVARTRLPDLLLVVLPALLIIPILAHESWTEAAPQTNDHLKNNANIALVNRGRYIVEDVAVCSQCHTPRNSAGNLERGQWLEGAPLWLLPAQPMGDWPLQAPRIAGSPGGSDADMIRLLTTGVWRDGQRLRPPMPQFRMSREDAESVVA
jgi:hypothetical protein